MEKKAKILLIDDDIDFVQATKMVLEKTYQVVVAHDGAEGLRMAKTEKPDLILLDVIMPVKDGFTAAEQFKKDPQLSKIPVLMLTSFSSRGGGTGIPVSKGMALETEDYIEKPVKPEELLARVRERRRRMGSDREYDPEYPTFQQPVVCRKTMIVKCSIDDKKIRKVTLVPSMINKKGQPEPLSAKSKDGEEIVKFLEESSREFGTKLPIEGDEAVVIK